MIAYYILFRKGISKKNSSKRFYESLKPGCMSICFRQNFQITTKIFKLATILDKSHPNKLSIRPNIKEMGIPKNMKCKFKNKLQKIQLLKNLKSYLGVY